MWIILITLFLTGLMLTGVKLSLMRTVATIPAALLFALIPLLFYRLSLTVNTSMLASLVTDYGIMTSICTVVVAESLLVMVLSRGLMEEHYRVRKPRRRTWLVFLPPTVSCAGLVVGQTLLFNIVSGQMFMRMAMLHAGAVLAMLAAGSIIIRLLIRNWIERAELLVVLVFFQLILAMFLPVIAAGLEMPVTQFAVDPMATGIAFAIMFIVAVAGYALGVSGLLPGKGIHT